MALLPPFYLDAVVAIGVGDDPAKRSWIGTGFIFGNYLPRISTAETKHHRLWLITNKHVVEDTRSIYVKLNSAADPHSKDYKVPLFAINGKPMWIGHPTKEIDIAAIWLNASYLKQEQRKYSFIQSDRHVMPSGEMRTNGITEGDRVFVLGYPMGLVNATRQYVICRSGALARVRDMLEGRAKDFLVDATVFPGNSGGPVIICPSALAIEGTKTITKANLIGIVKSYVSYSDLAVSNQTRKPRISFEENSGLATAETADSIIETVDLAEKRLKNRIAQAKHKAKKMANSPMVGTTTTQPPIPTPPAALPPPTVDPISPPSAPNPARHKSG